MPTITCKFKNYSRMVVGCDDPGLLHEMQDHFSHHVPGYRFMPKYKAGMWDGKIRQLDMRDRTMPAGLYPLVLEFAQQKYSKYGVECVQDDYYGTIGAQSNLSYDDFYAFVQSLNIPKHITPYEYQLEAAYRTLTDYRKIVLSVTGSGKSLIMYIVMRYILQNFDHNDKFLIIVPYTSLTEQLVGDFEEYSMLDETFDAKEMCHPVYTGQDKDSPAPVYVSTWQSISKFRAPFFRNIKAVIGDEAHTCKATVVSGVLQKCYNAKYRLGTSGTLDDAACHEMTLIGHFGDIFKANSTRELISEGKLSELQIEVLKLLYPSDDRRSFKLDYEKEVKFITKHTARNEFIAKLAKNLDGNTLILHRFRAHGELLEKMIKERVGPNRNVYIVNGSTPVKEREAIRAAIEKDNDAILVASIQTFSTGINIKNLHNLIFATPHKNKIAILQSIGRILRLSKDGRSSTMYDIVDDIHWKKRKNHALKHGLARVQLYATEKLPYGVYEIDL